MNTKIEISIIVPIKNEAENILSLTKEIYNIYKNRRFEIIFINDGSHDDSLNVLKTTMVKYKKLRAISHEFSSGQSAAIRSGVVKSRGNLIAILDGDGQNVPKDLIKMEKKLIKINPLLGMVAGIRKKRKDNWIKRYSSKIARFVRNLILNDKHPDSGCGIKIMHRELFLKLPFFKNMHRFMPTLVEREGGIVIGVEVAHRERVLGNSNYGTFDRLFEGIFDLVGVFWLSKRKSSTGKIIELNRN